MSTKEDQLYAGLLFYIWPAEPCCATLECIVLLPEYAQYSNA